MLKLLPVITRSFYAIAIICLASFASQAQFKVVGYLVNWNNFVGGANAVDYSKVTHINVAFINPDATGVPGPVTNLTTVSGIVHTNSAKILASLGGANANKPNWSAVMATPASRTAFITKLMEMVATHNLDGIDVDIEGDLLDGITINATQYESFVLELRTALHAQNKLMTAALGIWFGQRVTNAAAQSFDWINAMAYDEFGTWTGPGQHSTYALAVRDLNYWTINKGVDKDHLVLGIPSYGYGWVDNTANGSYSMGYASIVANYPRAVNQDSIIPAAGQSLYFNGVATIKDKTALAITNASGIMMWTLQFDLPTSHAGSLIRAVDEVVKATLNNNAPVVSITSPANNSTFTEGDVITITADATDDDGTLDQVSFYASINTTINSLGDDLTAPYSKTWKAEGPGVYNLYAKAKDNAYATGTSSNVSVTINAATQAISFSGPYAIPGVIEAENFDIGKDFGYYDLTVGNQGNAYRTTTVDIEANTDGGISGYNVGWIQPGEWLSYTVDVTATGTYDLKVRVATQTAGKYFHIEMNGLNVSGNIAVPNTGGWAAFQTVTIPNVSLTQGVQAMKLVFDTGDFNLNYVNFTSTVTSISDADASGNLSAMVSPNPFSHRAQLQLTLKNGGQTKVTVTNMIGASSITLADQYFAPGEHTVEIGTLNIPAGIYLCTITNGDHTKAVKIIKE